MSEEARPRAGGTVTTIAILALCYCYAMIDRQVLSAVTVALKEDVHLDDFQIGLLLGPAFALSYILFGIPLGMLSDRWSRRFTISMGLVVWSIGTSVTGLANSFASLFATRALTGAGESALVPSAHAMIAERVPRHQLAKALSIFGWGASIGIGLSSILGGVLLERFTTHPLGWLDGFAPWQQVYIVLGLPGFLIAVLVLSLRAPASAAAAKTDAPVEALKPFIRARWKLLTANYTVFGLNNIITYCTLSWSLPYLGRMFEGDRAVDATMFGIVTLAGPVVGSFALAAVVDRLYARGVHDAHYRAFGVLALVAAPICIAGFYFRVEELFWLGIVANALSFNAAFATGASAIQAIAPAPFRARLSAGLVSFVNFTGAVIGPPLVGFLVTYVFRDDSRLGDAMALIIAVCVAVMLPLTVYAARKTRQLHASEMAEGAFA